jgi:ornithine--oxo-acid transaminase
MSSTIDLENQFCAHNYLPLPVVLSRGKGVFVWDENGKKYLDMMSAYSAVSHGHANPRLVEVVKSQVEKLTIVSRAFYTDQLGEFLKLACELTGQDMALPMNSGAEGVETAIKAARKWGYEVKGIEKDKAEIIACTGNFWIRSLSRWFQIGPVRRRRGTGKTDHATDGGISCRTDPGRGWHRHAAGRLSESLPGDLPQTQCAADRRRDSDRTGSYRQHAGLRP